MGNQAGKPEASNLEGRDVRLDQRVSVQLAKGVKYNMKILIRGERQSGKTQLLRRLQGQPFENTYAATPEICTAHLIWEVPGKDESVKVEMWDVVDTGIRPHIEWAGVTGAGGKEQEGTHGADVVLLDASTINVYQGCDGMIICFDPAKRSTFEYAASMLKKAAKDLPVLLAANFRDKNSVGGSGMVEKSEVDKLVKSRARTSWIQLSCLHSFGMDEVRSFFMIPFMVMKHRSAERQLKVANEAMARTREKLDAYADTLNYEVHCKQWANGGAQLAKQQAERMQAKQKAAHAKRASDPVSPGGTKQKLVPLEKLMVPPKVDEFAPDLGKEVASFNTGKIDEDFFSSGDEMEGKMAVLAGSDDDQPNTDMMLQDGDISDDDNKAKASKGGGHVSSSSTAQARAHSDDDDWKREQEEELIRKDKEERAARLRRAKEEAEAKQRAEEDKLNAEMKALNAGGLDGFLDSDDEGGGGNGWGSAQASELGSEDSSDKPAKKKDKDSDSDSGSDSDDKRPEIMADEDLSD